MSFTGHRMLAARVFGVLDLGGVQSFGWCSSHAFALGCMTLSSSFAVSGSESQCCEDRQDGREKSHAVTKSSDSGAKKWPDISGAINARRARQQVNVREILRQLCPPPLAASAPDVESMTMKQEVELFREQADRRAGIVWWKRWRCV